MASERVGSRASASVASTTERMPAVPAREASALRPGELDYKPNVLIDTLLEHFGLRSDAALASRLRVRPPTLSKVRSGRVGVSAALLIAMHEASGWPIGELRRIMGDRREFFGPFFPEKDGSLLG